MYHSWKYFLSRALPLTLAGAISISPMWAARQPSIPEGWTSPFADVVEEDWFYSFVAALNAQDVRPLTDTVEVYRATQMPYELKVQYAQEAGSNITTAIGEAVEEYQKWQDEEIGRAFNPDKLMAMLYQAGAIRVLWGDGSNFNGGAVEYTTIAENAHCKGKITLAVMTT